MSELTRCNYCNLQDIKRKARKDGLKVVLAVSKFMGGTDVFVVPKNITPKEVRTWKDCDEVPPNGDENYQKYHKSWMMRIGSFCEC